MIIVTKNCTPFRNAVHPRPCCFLQLSSIFYLCTYGEKDTDRGVCMTVFYSIFYYKMFLILPSIHFRELEYQIWARLREWMNSVTTWHCNSKCEWKSLLRVIKVVKFRLYTNPID